ncbi:alkaline phosphatase family protein [Jiulongibacter sediminis]|jgi:predicted AlkP superfamily pyrophosphatase or phosphodiesterase|uniref:alkaline phosphatase family protein n=1 Tax=Jiulongibacter sediminis TaxID=1605367 RepID=UPI0026F302C8|nr:nucleotide pyrophosphatase/phosphodiesterase family protein [Jiulongibacter sediminis]
MNRLAVIDIVGLSEKLIGEHTPFLSQWLKDKHLSQIDPVLPAVTCSAQTTYLTGKWPSEHGIVGNGWFFKDTQEVSLWKQSNKLVQAENIWDIARKKNPDFTVANMFWWFNMYSTADYTVTPRPQYRADGQKKPDCYAKPGALRDELKQQLGTFPLFDFWGPRTTIKSSKWIAEASKVVEEKYSPTLLLVYLPHLDYVLQKFDQANPNVAKDLQEIDDLCKDLISTLEKRGMEVMVLSEYGISKATQPVHLNRRFRENGLIQIREENGLELLDAGESKAFAVADHQVAHVYINDLSRKEQVKKILEDTPGVELVLDEKGKKEYHIQHERAGDLVVVAAENHWFTYYYWLDDQKAPDFARVVDIHKKPGYDPVEMFFDPKKKFIFPRLAFKLLKKKLGFRTLMDVIPLDASLVKGSHGRVNIDKQDKPVLISKEEKAASIDPTQIQELILQKIFA